MRIDSESPALRDLRERRSPAACPAGGGDYGGLERSEGVQFRRSRTGKAETVWRFAQFFRGRRQVLRQRCAGRESRTAPVHCAYEQLSFINAACSSSPAFLLHYCIHQPNPPSKPHQLNPQHPTQQHYHINNRHNAFHRIVSATLLLLRRACRNPWGRRQSQRRYRKHAS